MSSNDFDAPSPNQPLEPDWDEPQPIERANGASEPAPIGESVVQCWRCERTVTPAAGRCPLCSARVSDEVSNDPSANPTRPGSNPLTVVLLYYGLFLLTSMVWGWLLLADHGRMNEDDLYVGTAVVEAIDAAVVLIAFAMVGRLALPSPPAGTRALAWLTAGPALVLLIGANVLYFFILRDIIQPPAFLTPEPTKLTPFTVLLICAQPAIVEELYFRYLALGALHRATGTMTAIWVSSVMFAMAHIYNPLGLPYLFLAGVVFGIARVYGGLLLPMILHFIHNFAVLAIEVAR